MQKMNRSSLLKIGLLVVAAAWLQCGEAFAQAHPERRQIRSGNDDYEQQDFAGAEERYRAALERAPQSYEAAFNLSDALYRQQKYDEAAQTLGQLSERTDLTPTQRAKVMHNLGNVRFAQQKLQEAADCYKESLRARPDDLETKYNLAYVQQMMQQQQNQQDQQNNQQNQDQNQNQQNQQNQSDQNQQNQNQDQQGQNDQNRNNPNDQQDQQGENDPQQSDQNRDQDQNQNGQNDRDNGEREDQPRSDQPQRGQGQISREDAESILDALQQQEDKTREKVNAQKAVSVGASGKNW